MKFTSLMLFICLCLSACAPKTAGVSRSEEADTISSAPTNHAWAVNAVDPAELEVAHREQGQIDGGSKLPYKSAGMRSGVISPGQKPRLEPVSSDGQQQRVLNFEGAEIAAVIHQIYGTLLQRKYVIEPGVKGKLSLYLEGEFSDEELMGVATQSLRSSGVDVVGDEGLLRIRPMASMPQHAEMVSEGELRKASGESPVTVIFRPRFIKAEKVGALIKSYVTPERPISTDSLTNSVVFTDSPAIAARVLGLLRALDMNVFDEMGMEVIPLNAMSPKEAVQNMEAISRKMGVFGESAAGDNLAFLPLNHFRGVLVLARNQELLDTARQWVRALDIQSEEMGDLIYVYQVRNGLAKNISEILNLLFAASGKRKGELAQHVVAAEAEPVKNSFSVDNGRGLSSDVSRKVLIIPDEINNAVIIKADANDLDKVKAAAEALDVLPRAVFIEMVIAEIDLTDELVYGVEWFLRNRSIKIGSESGKGSASFDTGTSFNFDYSLGGSSSGTGAIPSGLSLFLGTDDFNALLNLIDTDNNVNILSTPTLLALDNTEATISVGGNEPTISKTSKDSGTDTTIINDIQYEDTGISMKVTPHINAGGLIRMEVEQSIRSVNDQQLSGVDLNTPRFTEREVKTSLVAQDGKTVVIGGIIQTKKTNIATGVPVLSDIPVLSFFFSKKDLKTEKTELIVAITPHIVKRGQYSVAEEFIEKLNAIRKRITEGSQPEGGQ